MSEKKNAFNMLMIPRREQSEYIKLRVLYRDALEGKIENNMEKIGFFENYVLPSLAKQCEVTVNGICRKKYACLFPDCVSKKTLLDDGTEKPTFVDMQKYFRHLTTAHDQLLPGGGQFILPNDKSTVPGGFWCSSCGHHFCRQDSFKTHKNTAKHWMCANAEPTYTLDFPVTMIDYSTTSSRLPLASSIQLPALTDASKITSPTTPLKSSAETSSPSQSSISKSSSSKSYKDIQFSDVETKNDYDELFNSVS